MKTKCECLPLRGSPVCLEVSEFHHGVEMTYAGDSSQIPSGVQEIGEAPAPVLSSSVLRISPLPRPEDNTGTTSVCFIPLTFFPPPAQKQKKIYLKFTFHYCFSVILLCRSFAIIGQNGLFSAPKNTNPICMLEAKYY